MNSFSPIAQEEVRPDMTPMIDCVFLMIVFFVCIDFRQLEAKLPAYLPKDRGGSSKVEPREQLSIGVFASRPGTRRFLGSTDPNGVDPATGRPSRYVLEGHEVALQIGPTRFDDPREALRLLKSIRADRSTWVLDPGHPGQWIPMPVTIEPHPGTYYADVARAADLAREAGFHDVHFGGGLGALPRAGR